MVQSQPGKIRVRQAGQLRTGGWVPADPSDCRDGGDLLSDGDTCPDDRFEVRQSGPDGV